MPNEGKAKRSEKVTIPLVNREFSWLEFDRRVLGEAQSPAVPLLERLKFLSIASSNLDEFLMIRLGGLRDLMVAGIGGRSDDGLSVIQQIDGIRQRTKQLTDEMYRCYAQLVDELREEGIAITNPADLGKRDRSKLRHYFIDELEPILTPLAFDPGHPFPFLSNLSLNLAIGLESTRGEDHLVFLKVPDTAPRFFMIPGKRVFVPLERIIEIHVERLFPGLTVRRVTPFRVIRNADYVIREDEIEQDLLKSLESELRRRDRREVVWTEIQGKPTDHLLTLLNSATDSTDEDLFRSPGLLRLSDLIQLYDALNEPTLKDRPFNPRLPPQLATAEDIFSIIRKGDVLLHRPYDSFAAVVEYVQAAAEDPDVVAIKQTIYRSDLDAPIVEALARAASKGKQVAVVIELQARFDELMNITWARRLEEAGVQVIYGLVGIKIHCKLCLVVRRESKRLRRYVHLSTGNYNATTARLYTDIDLFTKDDEIGEDASQLMNLLTGFSLASLQDIFDGTAKLAWKSLIVSPMDYHRWAIEMVEREMKAAQAGKKARVVAKLNSLVDPRLISCLYRASQAGVEIRLLIRGVCGLLPGVEGLSDNIRVTSIVDRFLEHERIIYFHNDGEYEIYISSGDWMPRNFFRRIELTYPVKSRVLRKRLAEQILEVSLSDSAKAWDMQPDGSYVRRKPEKKPIRSQERFIEIVREEAVRLAPYEEAIKKPGKSRRKAKQSKKNRKKGRSHGR